ncbi:C13 family peptidase [Dokdonella sp.]|uniref:C13 family peptidase n=1 Tax=Dokdonella sp. TaxID=2291710 RepID=UPI0031CB616D|nr:C13 family peptidase [Dokdonella sp.]
MALLPILASGLRMIALRRPPLSALNAGAGTFFVLVGLWLLIDAGRGMLEWTGPWAFDAQGLATGLGAAVPILLAGWCLALFARCASRTWGVACVLLAATLATEIVLYWPAQALATWLSGSQPSRLVLLPGLAVDAWWCIMLVAFAHALLPRRPLRTLLGAACAAVLTLAANWWLPIEPTLVPASLPLAGSHAADAALANGEELPSTPPPFDAERVMFDQRALLDRALAGLAPQTPGQIDLYVIAFAGDAQERVFANEVNFARELFARRFAAAGRIITLVNDPATADSAPIASWTNLQYALAGIARKIDPAEDIVLVYLTTHGSEDHELLVDLDPLPLYQITPADLADALATTPTLRWKVVIVNACYSGGFIDALKDASTLVITSARADRSSFGCGAESDITYFGRAFLADGLNSTRSFRAAFALATREIAAWERADGEESSAPQLVTTPAIDAHLDAWRAGLPADGDAPVPFEPTSNRP